MVLYKKKGTDSVSVHEDGLWLGLVVPVPPNNVDEVLGPPPPPKKEEKGPKKTPQGHVEV